MSAVNKYETVMVISTSVSEEATAALIEKFKTLIEENGTPPTTGERKGLPTPSTTRLKVIMC